jgi:hypothetical protein
MKRSLIVTALVLATATVLIVGCPSPGGGTGGQQALAIPTGLVVSSPTMSSFTISWDAVSGATNYQLYRDTSAGGSFATPVWTGNTESCTDGGLAAGTAYFYKVQARYDAGSSALSAAASGTTVAPTPIGLSIDVKTVTSLHVYWNAYPGAISYELFRDTSSGGSFTNQIYTGSAVMAFDIGLSSGTTYFYKVQATYASISSPLSSAISVATLSSWPIRTTLPGGNISSSQVWTAAGSPYLIQGDTVVLPGTNLTINPGVCVVFSSSDSTGSGIDTSRVELFIKGTLTADASAGPPIVFYSQKTSPAAGDWYGIVFDSGSTQSVIKNAEIGYCKYGIYDSSNQGQLTYTGLGIHYYQTATIYSLHN